MSFITDSHLLTKYKEVEKQFTLEVDSENSIVRLYRNGSIVDTLSVPNKKDIDNADEILKFLILKEVKKTLN